jgi:hypothetical protein
MTGIEEEPKGGMNSTHPVRESKSPATSNSTHGSATEGAEAQKRLWTWWRVYEILTWTPPNCRWDPAKPPQFSMSMSKNIFPDSRTNKKDDVDMIIDVLFAFAAGFTVANLYYNHPILNILARDFGVRYEQVAQIPTVMQAGYASGLLFLCPLGDLLPRRPFVCGLVFFTATMWFVLNPFFYAAQTLQH